MTLPSLKALPLHVIKRLTYCLIMLLAVVAALALLSAREHAVARVQDATVQAAWQTASPLPGPAVTPEALFARFNIKQGSANADMSWQVGSVNELRASLLAFDLAQIRLAQVKISRSGTGFVVIAERTP